MSKIIVKTLFLGAFIGALLGFTTPASADVNVEFRMITPGSFNVGDPVDIGVYAVTDDPSGVENMCCLDVVFEWGEDSLQFLGDNQNGPYTWLALFFTDNSSINEAVPPADGDAYFTAWGQFPPTPFPQATTEGFLVVTLEFIALEPDCRTAVCPVESLPSTNSQGFTWDLRTEVLGTEFPGQFITGDLKSETLSLAADPCFPLVGDMNCDGVINAFDIMLLQGIISRTINPSTMPVSECCLTDDFIYSNNDGVVSITGISTNSLTEVISSMLENSQL